MTELHDWDPYNHIMELTKFCNSADEHLKNLLSNQKVFVQQINELNDELRELTSRVSILENIVMDKPDGL